MKNYNRNDNPILKLTFEFSLEIIKYCESLEEQRKFNMARQLFRSGTSIGANATEAQHAESKADFIHKFKIAAKEMNETEYWLLLCQHAQNYPDCNQLLTSLEEIKKVLNKIIASSIRKNPFSYILSLFLL